jgi:hypothetical protein
VSADLFAYDASTRMRWFAQMNCWAVPADLPLETEPDWEPCKEYRERFPKWVAAMRAVRASLTDEQQSWGWWRQEMLGTFAEWSEWWISRGKVVTINERGEATP